MLKKVSILTILIAIIFSFSLVAAPFYDTGSQRFTITAGASFPLSITDFKSGETKVGYGENKTHLKVGGYGSILYQLFVNEYIALGGEIGYQFNYDNETIVSDVPIQMKATVFPVQGKVDIPLSLGLGFSFLSRGNSTMLTPYISAEAGFDFYFNDNWGLGVKSGIWVVPELYLFSGRHDFNALGTFIPVSIAVTYRQ